MVTRSKGSVVVDPSSFQRSAGLTGGGTMSWQLAPAPTGDATGSEALLSAARGLGGALRGPRPVAARGYGTSAALILSDGVITTDTSLRDPPDLHPLASAFLAETNAALLRRGQKAGMGRCVESTLISDRLYRIERSWSAEGRPGDDFRSYVFQAFRGAMLTVRQIGDANGRPHGALRQPCRACQTLLPALGIAVTGATGWDQVPRPAPVVVPPPGPVVGSPGPVVGSPGPAPVVVPPPGGSPSGDTVRREWLLGAPFNAEGTGAEGLSQVAKRLLDAGAGATALVLVTWKGPFPGPHLLAAANRDGAVYWTHEVSDELPYPEAVDGVWSIQLDAGGRPAGHVAVPHTSVSPSVFDAARLGELRLLIAAYPRADHDGRVALRAEIATLIDDLGVRPGADRFTTLPPDLATALLAVATPMPTPEAVATVLAADPARLNAPQRAWQRDFTDRLAEVSGAAADLADRLHRLAVAGETSPASVPRLPAYGGQVIGLPPLDPTLADTTAGIYIDLTGRPDLAPYARPELKPIHLSDPVEFDLSTDAGRTALRDADRRRARAEFRTAHGADAATMTLLSTHDFHYVGVHRADEPREMALVPDLLAATVRAISPVLAPPAAPPQRPPRPPEPRETPAPPAQPAPPAEPARPAQAEPDADAAPPASGFGVAALLSSPAEPAEPARAVVVSGRAPVPGQRVSEVGFAYYALVDREDRPTGLLVVAMLPAGPRTRRWEAAGARSAGSPQPVGRQRAEEISVRVFGVALPAEESLPEVFGG